MENKTCRQCQANFTITDDDIKFLENISPEFGGKKYLIPSPTLCPECSMLHKLIWRNENSLYKRKCDFSGQEIISIYSPDKEVKVYDQKIWWSDQWNVFDYGLEFNFDKTFTEQFAILLKTVPFPNVFNRNPENSDYCNQSAELKNCYLVFASRESENVLYSTNIIKSKDSLDVLQGTNLENCYSIFDCHNSFQLHYSIKSHNCSESAFLFDCQSCHNCFMCANLRNKSYCFKNQQLSKEEYTSEIAKYNLGNKSTSSNLYSQFLDLCKNSIHKYANIVKSENVTGDDILECKNCLNCFNINKSENLKNVWWGVMGLKDSAEMYASGVNSELCYNTLVAINGCCQILFSQVIFNSNNLLYCVNCHDSSDCFGCIGLKNHKQYCIFNKQYSKEEYEQLVPKIIEHMQRTNEWGEYFHPSLDLFGYNETAAVDFWPETKEEVVKAGFKWNDFNPDANFTGPFYEPADDISYYRDTKATQELLSGIIKCEISGKPFRIMPQELALYLKNNIPVPSKHPNIRHHERIVLRNPYKLYPRQCMCTEPNHNHATQCPVEFQTTYAPARPEKVYCEECYQKSVI